MRHQNLIKLILLSILIFLSSPVFSDTPIPSTINANADIASPFNNLSQTPTLNYSTPFVSIGAQYSDLFGSLINSKFTQKITDTNAVALELDYGRDKNRICATWGTAVTRQRPLAFLPTRVPSTVVHRSP